MHVWRVCVSFVAVCATPVVASAQVISPNRAFGRYQQFTWQEQHGLPQTTVLAVTATRDGYVWVGTYEGAARFDGSRFTLFNAANTKEIGNQVVQQLLEDRAGHLWLGTYGGGLTRYSGGRFVRYTTRDGLASEFVVSLFEDRHGDLWIGTGSGLSRWHDRRFTSYRIAQGLPSNLVRSIVEDGDGRLWVGTSHGIAQLEGGRMARPNLPATLAEIDVRVLQVTRDGALWIARSGGGLYRWLRGELTQFGPGDGLTDVNVESLYEDADGQLWVGCAREGLYRFRTGRFERHSPASGLPGSRVAAIQPGLANDLWLGTDGGLVRLIEPRFTTYATTDGLSSDAVRDIYQDADGDVWVGTASGLNRFRDGRFRVFGKTDGLPDDFVSRIVRSADRDVWVRTLEGLVRWDAGRFVKMEAPLPAGRPITAMLRDRTGALWFGQEERGLRRVRGGQVTRFTKQSGLADDSVVSLFEDRAGNVWVGTLQGGMTRISEDHLTTWTTRDGLANDHVKAFFEDADGVMWIGTHGGGLSRLKNGRLATVSSREGLYNDIVFAILQDDDGNLWMNCNRGIWRTSLAELNAVADGRRSMVTSFAYGVADGMLTSEGIGSQLAGCKMRDGSLWFATVRGVVVVHPGRRSTVPPRLSIESAIVDRQPLPVDQAIRLEPIQENLDIQYTGLSWNRPQEIRFRYRLEGLDREWVEAGTRRTAYYSHLPPGRYTFVVTADNGEGVWNAEGQRLSLVVLPPFYRTWWFQSLALVAVACAIAVAWRVRVAGLTRAHAMQQRFGRDLIAAQERERQRIATELHDGLGQNLLIVKNRALLGRVATQRDDVEAAGEQLDEIASTAGDAIDEVRRIAYNLRPYHLDRLGLQQAIEEVATRVAASSSIAVEVDVGALDGVLRSDAAINCYRIVQEALNNIVKHARATTASIRAVREGQEIQLTIADNGAGFDVRGASMDHSRGGLGMVGVAERATMLSGTFAVSSRPDAGTTITVRFPVSMSPEQPS